MHKNKNHQIYFFLVLIKLKTAWKALYIFLLYIKPCIYNQSLKPLQQEKIEHFQKTGNIVKLFITVVFLDGDSRGVTVVIIK